MPFRSSVEQSMVTVGTDHQQLNDILGLNKNGPWPDINAAKHVTEACDPRHKEKCEEDHNGVCLTAQPRASSRRTLTSAEPTQPAVDCARCDPTSEPASRGTIQRVS